jgi:hypothetical protein
MANALGSPRVAPFELSVVAVAAAIIAIQVCFVAVLLGVGLARELYAATGHISCHDGQTKVRTDQGKSGCMSPDSELPRSWVKVSSGR